MLVWKEEVFDGWPLGRDDVTRGLTGSGVEVGSCH